MAKRPVEKIDFRPYGAAIKKARTGRKESRNKVGNEMFLSPRYLANQPRSVLRDCLFYALVGEGKLPLGFINHKYAVKVGFCF